MLSLIIGGDIVPSFQNLEYFKQGDLTKIADGACSKILETVDFRVFNLETPITDELDNILKEGANFAIPSETINGFKSLKSDVLNLANNHSKDQGEKALIDTIKLLETNEIRTIGYGKDFLNSKSTLFFEKNGIKIAVISCCETEFTIFDSKEIGAIPYHDYWINKFITEAKQKANAVIVLYHGGKEYYEYAAPYQMERCHLMVECGADFVLCQHSHCIGAFEEYKNGKILYGQGNFIFHQKNNLAITKQGLLAKITVDKNHKNIEFLPVFLNQLDQVCLMCDNEKEKVLKGFLERSEKIKDIYQVEKCYSKFALEKMEQYYGRLQGSNKTFRIIRRVLGRLGVSIYNKQDKLILLNLLQNEAHRELFINALKKQLEKEDES